MLLATTTQKIQAQSDATAITANPAVTVDWEDLTTPGSTPGASDTALNGTTVVDIVAAPAANTYRTVKHITIYNGDTIPHIITVLYNDNGTLRTLVSQSVGVGRTLEYIDGAGWGLFGSAPAPLPTRQVLTSGTSYNTPPGARQLQIRMVGAGGGGGTGTGSVGANGGGGGATVFNGIAAIGGGGGAKGISAGNIDGGPGGTGGSGTASFRAPGQGGSIGTFGVPGAGTIGGAGGGSLLGGGARGSAGDSAVGNGGGGAGGTAPPGDYSGGGGGGGEYVELIINSPSASYTYAIGTAGIGGSISGSSAGGNGFAGIIIVDEFY